MTIKQKQWQLYYLAYYGGDIDGIWGPMSEAATIAFQKDNGLDPDGIYGPLTENKSIEVIKAIQEVVGSYADGLAGNNTKNATAVWQRDHGLDADGIAGPITRAKIQEVLEDEDQSWWDDIKYFDKSEFKCKCGGRYCNGFPYNPKKKLVQTADRVREYFGSPAIISSGVRCEVHNANVGGVSNSLHMYGKAMDFCVSGKRAQEVLNYVLKQPEINYAYIIDANYVHIDIL